MTPSLKPMETFLNLHAHRPAASSSETVIRNYILPLPPAGHEDPEYGQAFSAGIHPWYIPAHPEETLKELDRLAASPFCKAIGEAGLDKFVSTSLSLQRELFVRQAELAAAHRLPVIVHCVKAWDELLSARKDIPAAAVCIIHGFRGKPQLAESLLPQFRFPFPSAKPDALPVRPSLLRKRRRPASRRYTIPYGCRTTLLYSGRTAHTMLGKSRPNRVRRYSFRVPLP